MTVYWASALAVTAGLAVAGCSINAGSMGPLASTPAAPPLPPPISYGAFLNGPVGSKLSPADRDKALASEQDALASGQRVTWKGEHGVFGYVEAAPTPATVSPASAPASPPAPADTCRAFTSTIYLSGRPQVGHGSGCQNPDGSYRIVG